MNSTEKKTRWWEYNIEEPFIKMLPTNLAASIGLAQLDKIDRLQNRRKEIWSIYQDQLSAVKGLINPANLFDKNDSHSYFTYCIRVPKRDQLAHYLLEKKIYTTLRYHPLHMNTIYNQLKSNLPNSEKLNNEALSIPIHPRLSNQDVEKVIFEIKSFYS